MNRALFHKEFAHHGPAVLWLAAVTLGGIPVLTAVANQMEGGSAFDGLQRFSRYFVPLLVAVLCHRLVVMEYQAKTQLFLEGLPVSRTRMVVVKYLCGLGVTWGLMMLAVVLSQLASAGAEPLDARLLLNVLMRALGWSWIVFNLFFLVGFLGRYRVPLCMLMALALSWIDGVKELRLNEFGPFALVDSRFGFERDVLPWGALRQTFLVGTTFLGLTALLVFMREGSVAALMAEKMSRREKVFFSALMMGVIVLLAAMPDRRNPTALDFGEDAQTARVGAAEVQVSNAKSEDAAARRLAHRAARELAGAFEYLGLREVPPLFITLRRDLNTELFDRDATSSRDGVSVDANFTVPGWREDDFIAWVIQVALLAETQGRAGIEHKLWVLDGFPDFWLARHAHANSNSVARHRVLTLRALYGTRDGLTRRDLETWLRVRERVGPEIAGGVAASGLAMLERRAGAERCRTFLRRVLATEVPKDYRAVLHESRFSPARLMELELGIGLEEFARQWAGELEAERGRWHAELAKLPVLRGEVEFVPLSSATRRVAYRVSASPAPPPESQFLVQHSRLSVFDRPMLPSEVQRVAKSFAVEAKGELPLPAARGSRLGLNFALEVPELECRVISGWRREEVR